MGHAAAIALALLALAAPAAATLYSYTDEDGITHYTNLPSDPRFRKVPGSTPPPAAGGGSACLEAERYEGEITRLATDHGVDPALVKAVIKAESNYDNRAISRKGALGLMQLMPETARLRNVDNPFNPSENIEGGVRHLKYLLSTFDDLRLVLAAYNAGENAVRKYGGVPPFPETKNYVAAVLSHYGRYSGLVAGGPAAPGAAAAAAARTAQIQSFVNEEGTRVFTNVPWQYVESPGWRREPTP
ncbi:MAG TPA: transglycosylase SLT domain-containing protein [Candidatus Methanoperedens sp.]|nr:transglycosylase SLT domain-containing protein [Candidatus Methanoperedens sp.]